MMDDEILAGQRFGMLTTVARCDDKTDARKDKRERWLCRCDCGKTLLVRAWKLRGGKKTNCGCVKTPSSRAPKGTRKVGFYNYMPTNYQVKYACNSCLHKSSCVKEYNLSGDVICKYAYILDDYSSYAEYEKKQGIPRTIIKRLLRHREGE